MNIRRKLNFYKKNTAEICQLQWMHWWWWWYLYLSISLCIWSHLCPPSQAIPDLLDHKVPSDPACLSSLLAPLPSSASLPPALPLVERVVGPAVIGCPSGWWWDGVSIRTQDHSLPELHCGISGQQSGQWRLERRGDSWKNAGLVTTHHLLWELSEKVQSRPDLTWPDLTWPDLTETENKLEEEGGLGVMICDEVTISL